jgi:DNA-directed RNA polymerase specialized sigma24 family protein
MHVDNRELAKYMLLIQKITNWKVKDLGHKDLVEDIVQEVFIKLFKQKFIENNMLGTESENKMVAAYIKQTVNSCYIDQLSLLGLTRRLTKAERLNSDNKYQNIRNDDIDDVSENELKLVEKETPEQQLFALEAYQWIKSCYLSLLDKVSGAGRKTFFEAAFWQLNHYDMPLKSLAAHLGYKSSNPTQELKRFVEKVSLCTQPHGVIINNPGEQIQFLREQIENSEAV